jgi:hypothetical protein
MLLARRHSRCVLLAGGPVQLCDTQHQAAHAARLFAHGHSAPFGPSHLALALLLPPTAPALYSTKMCRWYGYQPSLLQSIWLRHCRWGALLAFTALPQQAACAGAGDGGIDGRGHGQHRRHGLHPLQQLAGGAAAPGVAWAAGAAMLCSFLHLQGSGVSQQAEGCIQRARLDREALPAPLHEASSSPDFHGPGGSCCVLKLALAAKALSPEPFW